MNVADKDFKEFLKSSGRRYCETCKLLKPERCHHCRQCGKCILRMDHHCNWLYNCIGWTNYKYFLVFLMYAGKIFSLGWRVLMKYRSDSAIYTDNLLGSLD